MYAYTDKSYIHTYLSIRWVSSFLPSQEGLPTLQPSKFLAAGTHQEDRGGSGNSGDGVVIVIVITVY